MPATQAAVRNFWGKMYATYGFLDDVEVFVDEVGVLAFVFLTQSQLSGVAARNKGATLDNAEVVRLGKQLVNLLDAQVWVDAFALQIVDVAHRVVKVVADLVHRPYRLRVFVHRAPVLHHILAVLFSEQLHVVDA